MNPLSPHLIPVPAAFRLPGAGSRLSALRSQLY